MRNQVTSSNKNYANALLQTGGNFDDVLKDLKTVRQIICESDDLRLLLTNPTISDDGKISVIKEVFKQLDEKIIRFLTILINKKRFHEFDGIVSAFEKELDVINGIKRIKIISAISLDDKIKEQIRTKLEAQLQKKTVIDWQTDSEIIAGLVIKIEDDVLDSSLKYKLENLSRIM